VAAIGLGQAMGQHLVDDFIGHQPATGQDRTRQFAQLGAGLTLGTEHLSRGYGGNPETARNENGLRAFAATGRAEQKNDQGFSAI
jgi:hypothetical protein